MFGRNIFNLKIGFMVLKPFYEFDFKNICKYI